MALKKAAAAILFCAAAAAGYGWYAGQRQEASEVLKIYGSVDMRTVSLAFEEAGRLREVLVEEGDVVRAGDVLARLDSERYAIARRNAQAQLAVRQKELELLLAGSRTEEIDAARANVKASEESLLLAERLCERQRRLGAATTRQAVDEACSQVRVSAAQTLSAQKNLDLLLAGTRAEQIAVAGAAVALAETVLEEADRALAACELKAPSAGVIRSRMRHKGDMVSASAAVYELALTDPLWVRAWIDEVNLDKIRPGQKVEVFSDSFPQTPFEGVVGFISSVAEFTPKTVQTEELRTALVYEVRVTVADSRGLLRLGMPATVVIGKSSDAAN